ncbi:MAG: hypothetical protein ACQETB_10995 [Halobacteriota archaeon]
MTTTGGRSKPYPSIRATPFHSTAGLFLTVGLFLGAYQGAAAFGLVATVSWITWTHIHFVTIGAFTQLVVGTLPRLTARKLDRPAPSKAYTWATYLGLNGGLLAAWYGRAFGYPLVYDLGLFSIWAIVFGLVVVVLAQLVRSDRRDALDATVGLYLLSPVVFLYGVTIAFGLYSHVGVFGFDGGWWGLREAHVHANAWGFLGFAVIGTLFDLYPSLVNARLYSDRLKRYSGWLLGVGIWPLVLGPAIDMGRTVTATGLVLFAIGYVLFVYNLVQTTRQGSSSGLSRSVLLAQAWILAPAGFAPFILFGVPIGIPESVIETGALHFFFMGWALPVVLAGMALYSRARWSAFERTEQRGEPAFDAGGLQINATTPTTIVRPWMVGAWNVSVLGVGIGFFYPDVSWMAIVQGLGFAVIVLLWARYLAVIGRPRWSALTGSAST